MVTGGSIAVTGASTAASYSATGNVTGGNLLTSGLMSSTGNAIHGNILTGGLISATGNVSGNYILGNGALLTGVITSVANINFGTSNVTVVSSGGNITVGVGGTSNVAVFATTGEYVSGVISATGNITGGNLSGTNIVGTLTTASQTNITSVGTLGSLSVTANITGGNINTGSQVSAGGNITGGNITTAGVITVNSGGAATAIINGAASNAVGNIGSSSKYFNTVFATATTAQYADLAEKYVADTEYAPGTVVSFGGSAEVTLSTVDADRRIAGVVSTDPAYSMNAYMESEFTAMVALTGRVPCSVTGTVRKGDMMVSNGDGTARAEANPTIGSVIGKALEDFDGTSGVIEVVVGRL